MKIVLIGFMGAGKTSVADVLSKKSGLEKIEMDDLVVKKSKRKNVSEIFSKDGETRFRELEIEISKGLRKKDQVVISTGGGVVMNKINIDYLRENGLVIFLKTSYGTILKRIGHDDNRPLFRDKIKAKKLFSLRKKLYEEYCDYVVETDKLSVLEIVNFCHLL